MGRSGYTSLSIEEKAYARLRRNFDITIETELTFTAWCLDVMESAVYRNERLTEMFPGMKFVGKISNGCVIQDKGEVIRITVTKQNLSCEIDKGVCKHILFTVMSPQFEG